MQFSSHVRQVLAGGLAGVLLLGGCAGTPTSDAVSLAGDKPPVKFNTGNVTVVVTDFAGQPLRLARVDIESGSKNDDYFRTAAMSDVYGRVSFRGVPNEVRITVYHAESQGNYSREFHIPSSGTTELRMMIERTVY